MRVPRRGILLVLFLLLVGDSSVLAQNRYNVPQFAHETLGFVEQPGRWRGKDWLRLGLITAGTAVVMQVDQPVRSAVLRDHARYYHSVPIEAGRVWGEWYAPICVVGAFGLQGWLADNTSSKKIGFEALQAVIYAETITQALKIAFGRARPYENQGAFHYRPFVVSEIGLYSLPGGHNTNGWAMSTVLSRNAHSLTLKILAYAPAALTFLSRVYQDQHWTSDDFLGAAIGVVVGSWVVGLHERRDSALHVSLIAPLAVSITF